MNIYKGILEAADKANCSSTANDISCNVNTKFKMLKMMTEHKSPEKIIFNTQPIDVQSIKIGNRKFEIHTLECLKDGEILIENDISDGCGIIIKI